MYAKHIVAIKKGVRYIGIIRNIKKNCGKFLSATNKNVVENIIE
tara:strand:+ start:1089 stop:1220 length:132 start_codon:yes stop_codon:yes gene_type:complete